MQKIIALILSLVFVGLLYFNFFYPGKSSIDSNVNESQEKTEKTNKSESSQENSSELNQENLVFKEKNIQEKYEKSISNDEPLIIDVVLPSYYSDSFLDTLNSQFDTSTVQLNRIDLDMNTTNLTNIDIHENTDIVVLSALQIQDFNDEVLPSHNLQNVLNMYMNLLDDDKIAILLSEPNVYQHTNLENVILTDQTYLHDNDYYYIDNTNIEVENMYDEDKSELSSKAEEKIAENFKNFFLK